MSGESYDAVVIGFGLGGLTAGALLAKAGRTVCVIERNHSVGGCASVFKKGALTIEPALHQTADPRDPNEPKHAILNELGLLDEIEWIPVSPFFSVRCGLRLSADAAAAKHLGWLSTLAAHADSRALSRLVIRRVRRFHRRDDVRGDGGADGDRGMADLNGRVGG
jgi:glycine/D-amino acid oxidase-like deaminating enzyme